MIQRMVWTIVLVLCGLLGVQSDEIYFPPPESQGGWRSVQGAHDIRYYGGMDAAKLQDLQEWLFASDNRDFDAVVIRNGYIVMEATRGRQSEYRLQTIRSCAKAICGMTLAMVSERSQRGFYRQPFTFENFAFDFIPWAYPLQDERKQKIKIKQLLNHTSGILPEGVPKTFEESWMWLLGHTGDRNTSHLHFDPGTEWMYSTIAFDYAALISEYITGKTYDQNAAELLFQPLGIEQYKFWFVEGDRQHGRHPIHAVGMQARDLARIAYCMLQDGTWNGKRVVPEWFMADMGKPTHDPEIMNAPMTSTRVGYSHGWEFVPKTNRSLQKKIPADTIFKGGAGGQMIAYIPSLNMVIARQTGSHGRWDLFGYIQRAVNAVIER